MFLHIISYTINIYTNKISNSFKGKSNIYTTYTNLTNNKKDKTYIWFLRYRCCNAVVYVKTNVFYPVLDVGVTTVWSQLGPIP